MKTPYQMWEEERVRIARQKKVHLVRSRLAQKRRERLARVCRAALIFLRVPLNRKSSRKTFHPARR